MFHLSPKLRPSLDPEFQPASLWTRAYRDLVAQDRGARRCSLALVRSNDSVSLHESRVLSALPAEHDSTTAGRRLAHATYHTSHATDRFNGITWAMDLTPLITNPALSVVDYTTTLIDRFKEDVVARLSKTF